MRLRITIVSLWALMNLACGTAPSTGEDAPASDGTLSLTASGLERSGDIVEVDLEIRTVQRSTTHRPPVELVAILDTSESMTNRQVKLARAFLAQLVHGLGPDDRFALVTVSAEPTVLVEPSSADDDARSRWVEQMDAIEIGGLTNLSAAIVRASEIASESAVVLLVSDGSPTWGTVAPDAFEELGGIGPQIWTVGVGRNDETLLRSLGRYFYLRDAAELADMLALELFENVTPVATGLTLSFDPPSDVELLDLKAHVLGSGPVRSGSIYAGAGRKFRARYRAAPGSDVGDVTLRYASGDGERVLRVVDIGRETDVRAGSRQ